MISCLYTTQRTKKVKSWNDGYFKYNSDSKSILFDYEQKVLYKFKLKKLEDEFSMGIYLIQLEDLNSINKEETNTQKNNLILEKNIIKNTFKIPVKNESRTSLEFLNKNRKVENVIEKNNFEVVKIDKSNSKKRKKFSIKEAGDTIERRLTNLLSCLNEYKKVLNNNNEKMYAHLLAIDEFEKEINNFSGKNQKFLKLLKIEKEDINKIKKTEEKDCKMNSQKTTALKKERSENEIFNILEND